MRAGQFEARFPHTLSQITLKLVPFEEVSPDCGDMSPLSRRDMSRAKSAVVPAHSGKPATSRFSHLPSLPEGANVGQAVNEAMRAIEKENPDLADVLPKSYHILESRTLASEPELRSIRSNDLTVVASKNGDSKVPAPYEDL